MKFQETGFKGLLLEFYEWIVYKIVKNDNFLHDFVDFA